MKKIELLSPAGDKESFIAAINAGADAIYVGGKSFSARASAENFTDEELVEAIKLAHILNVKVYVGINIMIYENEINEVLNYIDFLYVNDVDALIVADLGLISILAKRYPNLDIHASTQLNTMSLWQIKILESYNVKRVVLARECSLSTIAYIKKNSNLEIEVFAHGALCVCYSGNCLHSSMIGKRSGNRGCCAQPCRMEYSLLEDGRTIAAKQYLLSTKDLNLLENIDKVIELGVTSLKIEGRMKSEEYVSIVTKNYRDAIDAYYKGTKIDIEEYNKELMKVFSRTFTKGFMFNENNSEMTNTFRPNHIGEEIGQIVEQSGNSIKIKLTESVAQKDKIAIISNHYDDVGFYLSKI